MTYGFKLIVRVSDTSGIEFGTKIVRGDDVAHDTRERPSRHTNEETFSCDGSSDDLSGTHRAAFLSLPLDGVNDLLVYSHRYRVREVPIGIGLSNYDTCLLIVTLMNQPTW